MLLRKTNFFFTIILLSAPLVCMGLMMYLPSYAVKKTRLSSSGHTTYGKVYVLRCFPNGQVCLLRIHNSGNSILLHEMCMLFSSDHLPPSATRSKCLKQINITSWSQMSTEEARWCTTNTAFECSSKVQRLWKKNQILFTWITHDRVSSGSLTTNTLENLWNRINYS